MSNIGLPQEIADVMYERAMTHPSRGRRKDGKTTSRSFSGLTGAYQKAANREGKWYSRIRVNGKTIHLKNKEGKTYFHSAQEAHDAYIEASIIYGITLPL